MHVFIGSPVWRDLSVRTSEALSALYRLMDERGIKWTSGMVCGDALVSRASSIAASNMLRLTDADVQLTFGSDVIFKPADALTLCEKALAGYDIIGALVMKRVNDPIPACPLPDELIMQDGQPPAEVRWMGTGFTATSRRVFERLAPMLPLCAQSDPMPYWPFYMPMVVPDEKDGFIYLSEDWALAQRAKSQGFKCYVDPTIRCGHLSNNYEVTVEDFFRAPKPPETAVRWRVEGDQIWLDAPELVR